MGAGKFAGEQEEILVHDTVHDKITVLGELVRLKHLFVTEPHLVVLPVVDDQIVPEGCPLEISFYLDALHSDPGVAPWIILISFIVDELAWTDEEGIALLETEQLPPCLVDAAAAQDIVDQVPVAEYGTIAVPRRAVFIAAGVDHCIDIPEKVV